MRILILSNLHPPHVVDPSNLRVEAVGKALQDRGHQTRVITSALGMGKEYDDRKVYRTFKLNGVYDVPLTTDIDELEEIEQHNNNALAKIIEDFKPELIYIWSLHGLGKSLMLYAAESGIPYTFDIADPWIRKELVSDPWLVHWNSSDVSIGAKLFRFGASLAGSGKKAPKTVTRGKKPVEGLFDEDGNAYKQPGIPFSTSVFLHAHTATSRHGTGLRRWTCRNHLARRFCGTVQRRAEGCRSDRQPISHGRRAQSELWG